MLGPITPARTSCSQKTYKDGSNPVVVRLSNNLVVSVNKEKVLKPLVGQLASVSGQLNAGNGTMKLDSANPIQADAIPANDPDRRLLDSQKNKTPANAALFEKVRHELAMLPYLTYFDYISFTLNGSEVILTGWTVRQVNYNDAKSAIRNIKGVESLVNNLQVLPLGSFDNQIRAATLAVLQQQLSMYFWGAGSDIKIIVKNGDVILLGNVIRQADADIAFIKVNGLPGVFHVFNLLQVKPGV
jgi:hypothetical protein